MAFTNFCCRSGGSNLNAGTLTGDTTVPGTSPSYDYTGTFATNTFTVSGANPQSDGVTAGMFVQVSNGSSIGRIARITSVTSTTIVLSSSATVTVNAGTYTVAKVGGAWAGPSGSTAFPFNALSSAVVDTTGNWPRINYMNDQTYSPTSAWAVNQNAVTHEGFESSYGDEGRAIIDGGLNAIVLLTWTSTGWLRHFRLRNNGLTGTNPLVSMTAGVLGVHDCVFHNSRAAGLNSSGGSYAIIDQCEFYLCNQSNTASNGAIVGGVGTWCYDSIFHDNIGGNTSGIVANNTTVVERCIFASNGNKGILCGAVTNYSIDSCDFYNNGSDGVQVTSTTATTRIANSNFVKNGGYGINLVSAMSRVAHLINNGFGAGTQANTSGQVTNSVAMCINEDPVTYATDVTPWADPANGDFRITLAAAQGAGRGEFIQLATDYAGSIGYPDIGACQHQIAGGVIVVEDD